MFENSTSDHHAHGLSDNEDADDHPKFYDALRERHRRAPKRRLVVQVELDDGAHPTAAHVQMRPSSAPQFRNQSRTAASDLLQRHYAAELSSVAPSSKEANVRSFIITIIVSEDVTWFVPNINHQA
jgi:hypothetical protein